MFTFRWRFAKIAAVKGLNLNLNQLRGWRALDKEGQDSIEHTIYELGGHQPEGGYRFPCRGQVVAGTEAPDTVAEDVAYYEFIDLREYGSNWFCLSICGTSTEPEFKAGGLLLVRPAKGLKDNRLYVFATEKAGTFQLMQFNKAKACLVPIQHQQASIQLDDVKIDQAFEVVEYKRSYL